MLGVIPEGSGGESKVELFCPRSAWVYLEQLLRQLMQFIRLEFTVVDRAPSALRIRGRRLATRALRR